MSDSKTSDFETTPADYQVAMIEWLRGYRNTQALQELMQKCRYSREEVEKFKRGWSKWLKPKVETLRRNAIASY